MQGKSGVWLRVMKSLLWCWLVLALNLLRFILNPPRLILNLLRFILNLLMVDLSLLLPPWHPLIELGDEILRKSLPYQTLFNVQMSPMELVIYFCSRLAFGLMLKSVDECFESRRIEARYGVSSCSLGRRIYRQDLNRLLVVF